MSEATTRLRAVARKFRGDRWYQLGEVVDVFEVEWRNAARLEKAGFLRELKYTEAPTLDDQGRLWITPELAALHTGQTDDAGGDRASPPSGAQEDTDAGPSGETEPAGLYTVQKLGGGWYNILVDGEVKSARPMRKADIPGWVTDHLPGYEEQEGTDGN